MLPSKGGADGVLWRLNGEGTTLWAARGGGSSGDYLHGVCVDYAGDVIAGGSYFGSAGTFGGVTLPVASGSDAVLWKLNGEGTTLWALRGGVAGASSTRLTHELERRLVSNCYQV